MHKLTTEYSEITWSMPGIWALISASIWKTWEIQFRLGDDAILIG